jgi:hypothetical protein
VLCPVGHYCELESGVATPCPPGTYSNETALYTREQCRPCKAGHLCDDQAISNISAHVCPPGHFCPHASAEPIECPAGTYYNASKTGTRVLIIFDMLTRSQSEVEVQYQGPGAEELLDCVVCPVGSYCPTGTADPLACFNGTYCPEGSPTFLTVEGGWFSNRATGYQRTLCPANHRCPRGAAEPEPCDGRTICDAGSERGKLCPAGFQVRNMSALGPAQTNLCTPCPAGEYSTIHQGPGCWPCEPGYRCFGATSKQFPTSRTDHNGVACDPGHFCPSGSSGGMVPCPEGQYNPAYGGSSPASCLLCDENSYNDQIGQEGCKPCGAFATSVEGASACSCIGKFRTFSTTDSSCRCQPGYDFKNQLGQSVGEESGVEDCSPLVFDRCGSAAQNQTRAPDGTCVDVADCSAACPDGGGVRSEVLGVCTCHNDLGVDAKCNQACRKSASTVELSSATTATITNADGTTQVVDLVADGQMDVIGEASAGRAVSAAMGADGAF